MQIYHEPYFTFRFEESRIIPRFHLQGVASGCRILIFEFEAKERRRGRWLASASVGENGWIELTTPIKVHAGEAFLAMPIRIRSETEGDRQAVYRVNQLAFGQQDESRLVDALRERGHARVSLVAEMEEQVVGHILFSELSIVSESGVVPALALAPMAVLPEFQRHGIGTTLVERGLERSRELGHRIVVVLGHPDYYRRFGFSPRLAERLESPFGNGPAHMAIELMPGALDGIEGQLEYAAPFSSL